MLTTDLHYQSAAELITALADKKISSIELFDATLARIEKLDKSINAVVVCDFDRARISAIAADAAIARGERRPLLGLPMTVKESFNIAGLTTSWGNRLYKDWRPTEDALVIARLKAAGAVILGKTNVPCMLGDWQSYNDIYGSTNNPWDLSVTPGGSSGGSAAALAAGYVALELGSDLAGSLRVPAHYCGVYAHKPTHHLIPLRGSSPPMTPPSAHWIDFVVAGPMARTAHDLAIGLDVLAGPDDRAEGAGYQLALPPARHTTLRDFRVLLLDTHPFYPTEASTQKALDHLAQCLSKAGIKVARTTPHLPDLAEIARNYACLLSAWFAVNTPMIEYQNAKIAAEKLSNNDTSLDAAFMRGGVMSHRDWLLTTQTRDQLRQQWRKLYQEFDVVLCPVMPTSALPHEHAGNMELRQIDIDGQSVSYGHQYIWASIATLFDLPATAAPIDRCGADLPIGIQIIGDYLEDKTTITFAHLLEREFGGFVLPPRMKNQA
jgi:amidase